MGIGHGARERKLIGRKSNYSISYRENQIMFEDDDFDLDLSEPLLDVTNSGVQRPELISGHDHQRSPSSTSSQRNSFRFKCPPEPTTSNVIPPSAHLPRNEVTKNTKSFSNKSSELSFDSSDKTDRYTRDFVERFESSLKRKEIPTRHSYQESLDLDKNAKRKFPGPAGIVKTKHHQLVGDKRIVTSEDECQEERVIESTVKNVGEMAEAAKTLFNCSTWMLAVEDLRPIFPEHDLTKYNIAWIKKQKAMTFVPHFLCKILKLDLTFKDPVVVLADKSGTIDGNLHRDIPELYGKDVRVGSVILVTRVAVLKTVKAEYLNITLNNLASIYSRSDVHHVKRHSKEDFTKLENQYQRQSEKKTNDSASIPDGHSSREATGPKTFQVNYNKSSVSASPVMPVLSPSMTRNVAGPSNVGLIDSQISVPTNVGLNRGNNGLNTSSGSNKFTFKSLSRPQVSRPEARSSDNVTAPTSSHQGPSPELDPPAQSQHLVASLLSDLDSSDIWADF